MLVQVPTASIPTQLPAGVPGKAAEDDPHTWAPALMWETQMELLVPGFRLTQL